MKNKPSVPPPVLHTQLALVFYVSLDILVVSDAAINKKNKTKQIKIQNNHWHIHWNLAYTLQIGRPQICIAIMNPATIK